MQNTIIDNCKTSKLYDIARIQGHGVLLAVDVASGTIVACSENIASLFGFNADQLLGENISAFFQSEELDILLDSSSSIAHCFWQTTMNTSQYYVSGHANKLTVIVEFERSTGSLLTSNSNGIGFMHDIALIDDPEKAARFLMEHIAKVTGFDRVMLYKFLPGWHGVVLAEKLNPGVEGFLGLHFPAGDVPENARKLYTINLQRYIADTDSRVADIYTTDAIQTLDLTYSQLRAVHPVHIEYLKNIGARSSFSVSLMASGKLWGMIACHHQEQKMLDFSQRFYCEELSRMTSLHISGLIALGYEKHRSEVNLKLSKVENEIEKSDFPEQTLEKNLIQLMTAFNADSIVLKLNDHFVARGVIEQIQDILPLQRWLERRGKEKASQTNVFPEKLGKSADLMKFASGILFIPLGSADYLALLRNEQKVNQQWAGQPPQDDQTAESLLTPRASFKTWEKETSGIAEPWSEVEIQIANDLSHHLIFNLDHSRLEQYAMQDSLTGLPNRRKFELELTQILKAAQKRPKSFAVYMLDLDKFKDVNDTLGHQAGDELLNMVGARMKKLLREKDTIARLGGDEFAMIQYNVNHENDIKIVAERIINDLGQPFTLQAGKVEIGISIGVALYPDHSTQAGELMALADESLYKVKNGGRNNWKLWST